MAFTSKRQFELQRVNLYVYGLDGLEMMNFKYTHVLLATWSKLCEIIPVY